MQVQNLVIDGEELFLASYVDRVHWGDEQIEIFAEAVKQTNLSLRALAEKAGVAHSYVDKLRKTPCKAELSELRKVLSALGLTIYSVFRPPCLTLGDYKSLK